MAKKKEEKVAMTRAQKTEATKGLIKELLAVKPLRHNELIEETAKLYIQRFKGEDTENVNDVKGRAGSVLDIMQKESEVMYDGGMYALKARILTPAPAQNAEEKPKKTKKKKAETVEAEAPIQEEPAPKKRGRKAKTEKIIAVKLTPPSAVEEKIVPPMLEEVPTPKKRGRKAKAEEKPVETPPVEAVEEPKNEQTSLVVKPKAEVAPKGVVDMSFLIGVKEKPEKKEIPPKQVAPQEKPAPVSEVKAEEAQKPQEGKIEQKPLQTSVKKVEKRLAQKQPTRVMQSRQKPLTAEEKLREAFLKKMRALGGDYFEYYSIYLLERYSLKNGRRLEGMKISGGERDGGIDGEIELTDKFGFRETIYIQSKNWDPEKGKEENWVVGETLLQQFIGACACRQARDRKLHARGIFVTTSRFTPEAKHILEDMSDKIVGYDGVDLFEAAKECSFGVVKRNGEWVLDEKLLSGTKAFFNML